MVVSLMVAVCAETIAVVGSISVTASPNALFGRLLAKFTLASVYAVRTTCWHILVAAYSHRRGALSLHVDILASCSSMLHVRVGKDFTSPRCALMLLADYFVAYAILAQPRAMLVVLAFSSIFCAQLHHVL